MMGRLRSTAVRLFWRWRFRAGQPATWLHEETVRRRVNRRVSGSEHVWPLEWFLGWLDENAAGRRFDAGLSLGCGEGALERAAVATGLCRRMLGLDLSGEAVQIARRRAAEAGLEDAVTYRRADLDQLELRPDDEFQIGLFHQSLHHVQSLETCLGTLARALPADGLLYLDEYVGPSRHEWSEERLEAAQAAFDALPRRAKRQPTLELPVDWRDPSEAIRSSDILDAVEGEFEILERRDYGGNVLAVTYPWLQLGALDAGARDAALRHLLDAEDELLASGAPSYYSVIVARPVVARPRT